MLKKLTKYEFKATGRTLGILYLALIILSCVCRLIFGLNSFNAPDVNFATGISSLILIFLYGMLICAVLVVTFLMIIQRFWKNLLQNEGYLMNMLPVRSWQHIASKLLVSVVWTFASVIVVFLSILILSTLAMKEISMDFFREFWTDLMEVLPHIGFDGAYLIIMSIVILLLMTASEILQLYAAMSVGQTQNRYKILCSFAAYIVLSIIFQLIVSLLTWSTGTFIPDGVLMTLFSTSVNTAIYAGTTIIAVYYLAKCAILFFITNYCLKNKLNLE